MRVIVIGHGIAGLTSAHTLASSGHDVTIMAEDHYQNTVSSKACAVWLPIFLGTPLASTANATYIEWGSETFKRLALSQSTHGVIPLPLYRIGSATDKPPLVDTDLVHLSRISLSSSAPEMQIAWRLDSFSIDMPRYLHHIAEEAASMGVKTELGIRFSSLEQVVSLASQCDVIVNCAGYGSAGLMGDETLRGVKGVVMFGRPRPSGMTGILSHKSFVLAPRMESLVLGALYKETFDSQEVEVGERLELERWHRTWPDFVLELVGLSRQDVENWSPDFSVAGLRPVRERGPRTEVEVVDGATIVHNYGHGGSGVTLSWGCAAWTAAAVSGCA